MLGIYNDQEEDLIDLLARLLEEQQKQAVMIGDLQTKIADLETRIQSGPGLIEASQLKALAGQVEKLIIKKVKRRRIA